MIYLVVQREDYVQFQFFSTILLRVRYFRYRANGVWKKDSPFKYQRMIADYDIAMVLTHFIGLKLRHISAFARTCMWLTDTFRVLTMIQAITSGLTVVWVVAFARSPIIVYAFGN